MIEREDFFIRAQGLRGVDGVGEPANASPLRRVLDRRGGSEIGQQPQTAVQIAVRDHGQRASFFGVAFLDPDGYVVAFELAAMIRTVALVAAVYIARRKASDLTDPRANSAATKESA